MKALTTLRQGGFSKPPYESLNFGYSSGDEPEAVTRNRKLLYDAAKLPSEPIWLKQVHGIEVIDLVSHANSERNKLNKLERNKLEQNKIPNLEADASFATKPNHVCIVTTADCLPVLICDRNGTCVAAAHAGWKGLVAGVIEATVQRLKYPADQLLVWLGPALGPDSFEVDKDVRDAYIEEGQKIGENNVADLFTTFGSKWKLNIYLAAKHRLNLMGIASDKIYGGDHCTYKEVDCFHSFRRSTHEGKKSGRMASLIWLED